MKRTKIVSVIMASAMLLTNVPSSVPSVFAKSADSSIQVTSETSSEDDIKVDSSSNDISVTDGDSDIVVKPEKSTEDISVDDTENTSKSTAEDSDNTNTEKTEDVTIESEFTSSIESKEKDKLSVGDTAKLHVKAENKSADTASLKLYFSDTDTQLTTDKMQWSGYLTKPAMSMSIKGLNKECMLSVPVKTQDDKTIDASLKFLKEVKNDVVVSRYAVVELPAGASTEFDMTIANTNANSVSVIPVMEQKSVSFGDAATLTWKNDDGITVLDKIANTIVKDDKSDDIQISDVQGVEKGVEDVDKSDFASKRLVAVADDKSVFTDADKVIGQYDNIYLLQYDTVKDAKDAYARLKDSVTAVEPDKDVTVATEATAEESTETIPTDANADIANAIDALNDMDASEPAQKEKGVIALIDTGVSKSENVIDSVSMIDDTLAGGVHGDKMLSDILSQDADAKVLSIRAMNDNGSGKISSLVAAMEYAIDQKVDYINLSLYARTTLATSVLEQEIMKATKAGIIVIGAAGNAGADVKDYVPGSVMEAYIIGAAKADGTRQTLSNFGDTVDYNVVAETTSDATALFTGYVSKNGLDSVSSVLNKGLIYATNYTNVREPIKDTGEVFPVELSANGNIRFVFSNLDGSLVKEETLSNETKTVDVPMTGVHVDVIADETEALSDVSVVDNSGNDITDVTVQRDIPDWMKGVRNTFFTVDKMQKMKISAKSDDMGEEIPMFDEIAQTTYFESLLCGDDCLEEHVRKGDYGIEPDNTLSDDEIKAAGAIANGSTGSCEIWFVGRHYTKSGSFNVTFQSGALNGQSVKGWHCINHGAANPGHNGNPALPMYYGDYTVNSSTDNGNGTITYSITVRTRTSGGIYGDAGSGYQNIAGTITLTPPKEYTSISIQKTWSDQDNKFKKRPTSVTVNLIKDGKAIESKTLTQSNGWYAKWDNLLWKDNGTEHSYDITENAVNGYTNGTITWKGSYKAGWVGSVTNTLQTGWLKLHKDSANPDMTNGNNCYSLADAEYKVYTDEACTKLATYNGSLVTDKNGDTGTVELLPGTYWVKETKAPKTYELDKEPHPVTIKADHTAKKPALLNVKDEPGNDPLVITINKIWNGEETPTIPSLAGTQFTVKYFDNMDKNTSGTPKKTWVLEVQKNASGVWRAQLDDDWLVKDKSDSLYKSPRSGIVLLPYGTYSVQETQHAPGYTFEGTWGNKDGTVTMSTTKPYVAVVDKNTTGGINLWGGNEYTGQNKPHDCSIKIRKVDENGNSLSGVQFTLKNSKGELVSTKTSGSDGYVVWDKLYPDIYTVTEIKTANGKSLLAEDIEIKLPMRFTEEDIKKYNIDRSKLSEWDKEEKCYYLFDVTYEVSNDVTFTPPMTGAMITAKRFIPIACGMVVLMGATCIIFFKRKKKRA